MFAKDLFILFKTAYSPFVYIFIYLFIQFVVVSDPYTDALINFQSIF